MLVSTLKASASVRRNRKSCTKKMALLTGERDRLDQRLKQLPAAISAAHTRVARVNRAPVAVPRRCIRSDVEPELHDVPIGHHVVLTFHPNFACSFGVGH